MSAYAISPRGVRALTQLVRGPARQTSPGFSPAAVSPDALPPVYTVRWAQSENNGAGNWIIYLAGDVLYDGPDTPIPVTNGLTAAANYPPGWYIVPSVRTSGGDTVLLAVGYDFSSAYGKWELSAARINQSTGSDYECAINIAEVSRDDESGAVAVTQLVVGALVLPPPFGRDEEEGPYDPPTGGDTTPKPWDIENDDLVRRYFNVGGITYLWTNGAAANVSQRVGYICLKIGAYGGNPLDSAEIVTAADMGALAAMQRDEGYYVIPLWHRSQNGDLVDMRVTPQLQLVEAAL